MSNDTELGALLSSRGTDVVDHLDLPTDLLGSVHTAHRRHRRNRIAGSALSMAVVLAGAGIAATSLAGGNPNTSKVQIASPPTTYRNARFGYSAKIPGGFVPGIKPTDGDGMTWSSGDRAAHLTVFGENNVNQATPASEQNSMSQTFAHSGGVVSYATHVDISAVVSGTRKGIVYYQREYLLGKAIYGLEWEYPVADKPTYDPLVVFSVNNFRLGPNRAA
jgi:hypothetical protein